MLLQKLSDARGVSGNEDAVREILIEEIRPHVDEYRVDNIGNLIATVRAQEGVENPRRVMVAAHMDEVGLMIVQVGKDGMLHFRPVGGVDPRILPAKRVLIGKEAVPGVIGIKATHLVSPEEEGQVLQIDQLYIDIGAKSKEDAEGVVHVGDLATFATRFRDLSPTVMGKALDDRAGCTVLAELVKERYPVELVAVFTVQEEVGLRGARVAAYHIQPDLGIALEGTVCDDLPRDGDYSPFSRLGHGPVVTAMDRQLITNRRLLEIVLQVAREENIPCQVKAANVGGTDAGAIQLAGEGAPAIALAVPCRFIHAPVSLMNLKDMENTLALTRAMLRRADTYLSPPFWAEDL